MVPAPCSRAVSENTLHTVTQLILRNLSFSSRNLVMVGGGGLVFKSRPALVTPIDCSPPPSVHGISQARILEWIAISYSRGSSGLNPCLRHCKQVLYCLRHQESPSLLLFHCLIVFSCMRPFKPTEVICPRPRIPVYRVHPAQMLSSPAPTTVYGNDP